MILDHPSLRGGQSLKRKCVLSLLNIHIGTVNLRDPLELRKQNEQRPWGRRESMRSVLSASCGEADGPFSLGYFRNDQGKTLTKRDQAT